MRPTKARVTVMATTRQQQQQQPDVTLTPRSPTRQHPSHLSASMSSRRPFFVVLFCGRCCHMSPLDDHDQRPGRYPVDGRTDVKVCDTGRAGRPIRHFSVWITRLSMEWKDTVRLMTSERRYARKPTSRHTKQPEKSNELRTASQQCVCEPRGS